MHGVGGARLQDRPERGGKKDVDEDDGGSIVVVDSCRRQERLNCFCWLEHARLNDEE